MSSVNTNFSNLISYMQEEDSKKSSLSGLVDLKYKEYDDSFKDFFENIILNSVNYKIFIYIYYLLKNQYQLLTYGINKEENDEINGIIFDNSNLNILNKELENELEESNQLNNDPTNFQEGSLIEFNFNQFKKEKGIDELIVLVESIGDNPYNFTVKKNNEEEKEFMYYHLLNIIKIFLSELLTQKK